MAVFSKLKKQIDGLLVPELKMQFRCSSYPTRTQWGNSAIPRFFIVMSKTITWDCPKNISVPSKHIHNWSMNNGICELVRDYIDTPIDQLLHRKFENENWECDDYKVNYGLTDLFKCADRRLGIKALAEWCKNVNNREAHSLLNLRFGNALIKYRSKMLPAMQGDRPGGYVLSQDIPRDQWCGFVLLGLIRYDTYTEYKDEPFWVIPYGDYEGYYYQWIENKRITELWD